MRVLLVTWTDQLLEKLSILNPELEYCAIVVDEVKPAKEILRRVGLPATLLYPMYDIKECINDFYYDYVLCVENWWWQTALSSTVKGYDVPRNKILNLCSLNTVINFLLERSLRYFKEHAAEFDMFATGMSYTEFGLDVTRFKRKLFNLGCSAQDLYYNFQVAKHALVYGGGHNKLKYALTGFAPFSFHYDLSKALNNQFWMLSYLVALNDLHNFYMPAEDYKKLFRPEYFSTKVPLEPFDLNNPYMTPKLTQRFMTPQTRLESRKMINAWSERYFPETRAENIKILDDYLTLCEQNNIRSIMFLPPMTTGYKKHFKKQWIDEFYYLVGQACKKHPSAIFIDGWKLQGLSDSDFYSADHLNIQGAVKFSAFLNDFIERL